LYGLNEKLSEFEIQAKKDAKIQAKKDAKSKQRRILKSKQTIQVSSYSFLGNYSRAETIQGRKLLIIRRF
jgi:hypothetical protein